MSCQRSFPYYKGSALAVEEEDRVLAVSGEGGPSKNLPFILGAWYLRLKAIGSTNLFNRGSSQENLKFLLNQCSPSN